ncbi:hypothetical protein V6N13_020273 [Hibiscus sabdariffa]
MTPASLKSNAVVMRPHDNTTPHALTDTSIDYVSGPSLRFRNLLSYKVVVMGDLNPHLDADSIAIDDDDDVDLLDDDVRSHCPRPQLNLVIASMVDVVRFVGPHIVKLLGPEKPGSLHQTRAYRSQLMMPLFPQDDLLTMIINN